MLKLFQTKNNRVRQSPFEDAMQGNIWDFKDVDFKDEQIICKAVRQMDSGRDHKDKTVTWQKGG